MRDVAFCTDSFSSPEAVPYGERTLACLLWALVNADIGYLIQEDREAQAQRRLGNTPEVVPSLYQSGIVWRREEPIGRSACRGGNGQEQFLGPRQILEQGWADCEDVACWRVAELRLGRVRPVMGMRPNEGHPKPIVIPCPWDQMITTLGIAAVPAFFKRQTGPNSVTYHIIVAWPDGRGGFVFEDPSRVLGMGRKTTSDRFG